MVSGAIDTSGLTQEERDRGDAHLNGEGREGANGGSGITTLPNYALISL